MSELPFLSPLERVLLLRNHPDFLMLDPSVLIAIASHTDELRYRAGTEIYAASDSNRYVHFLVTGTVRATLSSEVQFDIDAPGGVGLMAVLARNPEPGAATALTDVVTLRIEIDNFLQVMEDHFYLVRGLIRNFTSLISDAEARLEIAPGREFCGECIEPDSSSSLDLVQRLWRARQSTLFRTANLTMLSELLRGVSESYVKPGEWLFRAGQQPDSLHLVFEGVVRIENPSGSKVAFAGPGDLVALSECWCDRPHSYGAVTHTAVQLLKIDKTHYLDLLEDHFDHALDLLAVLAQQYLELRAREQVSGHSG